MASDAQMELADNMESLAQSIDRAVEHRKKLTTALQLIRRYSDDARIRDICDAALENSADDDR